MTIGATRNTKRNTTSLERSIVLEPTKKIQTGLLAVALGLGSAALTFGITPNVFAQTPVAGVAVNGAASSVSHPSPVRSQELLLMARRSLMSRDVASATRYVNEAKALNATYTSASDRPEYVFPLIEQYKRIVETANSQGMTESVKRDLPKNYLEQAEALLKKMRFEKKALPGEVDDLIDDPQFTNAFPGDFEADLAKTFPTKLDLCEYFSSLFHEDTLEENRKNVGLWTWLAFAYFRQLVKTTRRIKDIPANSRWIYDCDNDRYWCATSSRDRCISTATFTLWASRSRRFCSFPRRRSSASSLTKCRTSPKAHGFP